MKSGIKIAVCGKGGVGKTSVCAVLAELLGQDRFSVLAIDADSNPNLSLAFGVPTDKTPKPLIEMKELIQQRTGAKPGAVGQYFKLNPKVADLPEKFCLTVGSKVKLLVLGGTRQAGSGCACPESAFLKALLTDSILNRQEAILVDMDAGVEFLGRASVQGIDVLVIVVEPGGRSIETANKIAEMAGQMGITHLAAIANKLSDPAQKQIIAAQLDDRITLLGTIKYDTEMTKADLQREAIFSVAPEVVGELVTIKENLMKLVATPTQ